MSVIEKFCQDKNPIHLKKLSKKDQEKVKEIFFDLKNSAPKSHIKKILEAYFNPQNMPDLQLGIFNFCEKLAQVKLTKHERDMIFYTLYNECLKNGIDVNLKGFTVKDIKKIFKLIDKIYLNNKLEIHLKYKINFVLKESKHEAGACGISNKEYCIYLSKNIPSVPFIKQNLKKQVNGGISCYSPLECLLITYVHEVVHLIMFNFCQTKDRNHHPKMFRDILFNISNQTNYRHNFGQEVVKSPVPKDNLTKGRFVCFLKDGKEIKGVITRKNQQTCSVDVKGEVWKVPYDFLYVKN